MSINATKKGVLLQRLISFLLNSKGKAKREDVYANLLKDSNKLDIDFPEKEYISLIESIATLCIRAGWLKKSGHWRITKHGEKAHKQFSNPKELLQTLIAQAVIRNENSTKPKTGKWKLFSLVLTIFLGLACSLTGLFSANTNLLYLTIASILAIVSSLIFYYSRTKLILLSRVLFVEHVILSAIILFNYLFTRTSFQEHTHYYFWASILLQIVCLVFLFTFPKSTSKIFNIFNRQIWIIWVLFIIMTILFGGRYSSSGGIIESFYGKDTSIVVFVIIYGLMVSFAPLILLGGIASQLERLDYYE